MEEILTPDTVDRKKAVAIGTSGLDSVSSDTEVSGKKVRRVVFRTNVCYPELDSQGAVVPGTTKSITIQTTVNAPEEGPLNASPTDARSAAFVACYKRHLRVLLPNTGAGAAADVEAICDPTDVLGGGLDNALQRGFAGVTPLDPDATFGNPVSE